ncbi:carbonic anhydrase [Pseudonocardia hierapolitana]|uniref:carbonic anhydrase n=1 Tax=Pseudonocardia hierapolitana TaxID=1128676 RepID=A0A561SV31_9PSEU|nr:carbonic anhydrase family protein [Pseudonocardia hierapolitana]TWF78720.1 carbonic anhydrase [Pseudonocardia hierapolitana]
MDLSRRTVLLGVPALAATALITPSAAAAPPRQSPIHIRSREAVTAPDLPALEIDYPRHVDLRVHYVRKDESDPAGCSVRGREEVVEAEVPEGAAGVRIGGTRYELLQFHFHTPAEHRLDGRRFPVEQHFVHRGPDGETLVVGLFLTPGGHGGTVQDAVLGGLPEECGPEREVAGDLAAALPRELSTFRYQGSLTTSPYSEPVSWLVLARQQKVAAASLNGYRKLFPEGDARETQPLNGRVVQFRPQ